MKLTKFEKLFQHHKFSMMKVGTIAAVLYTLVAGVQCFSVNSAVSSISLKTDTPISVAAQPLIGTYQRGHNFQLKATTSKPSSSDLELDTEAVAKYGISLVAQLSLIAGFFYGIDSVLASTGGNTVLPTPVTWFICYAFSLKSRTFNPLNNARPDREKAMKEGKSDGFKDRNQPSWTPPGVVFPIMWLLIIGPLRATSATMVIESLGGYLSLPLMSLMLHLSCGDIWNTINNTEKRYGTAVLGIVTVYVSALHAAWRFYQVDPMAGKLLGATSIWLTIAGTLIFEIWRLNPNESGEKDSFLPVKAIGEDSITKFSWSSKNKD